VRSKFVRSKHMSIIVLFYIGTHIMKHFAYYETHIMKHFAHYEHIL
jgi:hypothetical protein